MEILDLPTSEIEPNPWNPNKLTGLKYESLVKAIKKDGRLRQPLLVRTGDNEHYQIVDGEHRWRAAKQCGLKTVDCVVIELDDEQAKTTTIAMNNIKGRFDDLPLAALLAELNNLYGVEKLKELVAFNERELAYYFRLLETPKDFTGDIVETSEVLVTINFLVTAEQEELITKKLNELNPEDKSRALVALCGGS